MMDNVTLLAGVPEPARLRMEPFSTPVLSFLDRLSRNILSRSRELGTEITAFGFWCRNAHLLQLKQRHEASLLRLGRGMVFHIAPANVPTMFAYSYAIGLLAGNSNVVRLSQRAGKISYDLCRVIAEVLEEPQYRALRDSTAIITYPRDDTITEAYMAKCDVRVIWGGDDTVRKMGAFPMASGSTEISFPDRWSMALISQKHLCRLCQRDFYNTVHRFYNDTYVMDQLGCSSPQMVLWLSDGGDQAVRERFWQALGAEAAANYSFPEYKASKKLERATLAAMTVRQVGELRRYQENLLYVLSLNALPRQLSSCVGGFGMFFQGELTSLSQLPPHLDQKLQTISTIGIDRQELAELLNAGGIPWPVRIPEAGGALEMDTLWDGKDLIALMSQEMGSGGVE